MKLGGGLWQRIRIQGGLLKIQAMFKTEVLEPLTLPGVEEKDPTFRNGKEARLSFCGRSWTMGTACGDTRLANVFFKVRCCELCPWVFSLGPGRPWQDCTFPHCYPADHWSLPAMCEVWVIIEWHQADRDFLLGFGSFVATINVVIFYIQDTPSS